MYKKKKKVKNKISKFQNGNLFGWRRKSGKKSLLVLEISKYWRSIVFYWIVLMGEGPTDFSKLWFFVIFSSENKFSLYNPYLLLSLSTASFWNFLCLWAATPFTFWRSHFPDAVVEFLLSPPPKPYSFWGFLCFSNHCFVAILGIIRSLFFFSFSLPFQFSSLIIILTHFSDFVNFSSLRQDLIECEVCGNVPRLFKS